MTLSRNGVNVLLKNLIGSAKRSTEKLSDLEDEEVVGYIRDSLMQLRLRLGIKFTFSGNTWEDLAITFPESVDDDLIAIIILQAKQIANSNSSVKKTKVSDISIEYNEKAWNNDEDYLSKMIDAYASENGLEPASGYAAFSMNEYDMLLNPDISLDTLERAKGKRNFYK